MALQHMYIVHEKTCKYSLIIYLECLFQMTCKTFWIGTEAQVRIELSRGLYTSNCIAIVVPLWCLNGCGEILDQLCSQEGSCFAVLLDVHSVFKPPSEIPVWREYCLPPGNSFLKCNKLVSYTSSEIPSLEVRREYCNWPSVPIIWSKESPMKKLSCKNIEPSPNHEIDLLSAFAPGSSVLEVKDEATTGTALSVSNGIGLIGGLNCEEETGESIVGVIICTEYTAGTPGVNLSFSGDFGDSIAKEVCLCSEEAEPETE
ncbi:hypothetical protein ACJIZ3_006961 [Penstemon smallii]|uniref:Uncharacterized protein n=1 Tax=Penstemon smallii TaxID=265156 RepID=A0ABD3S9E2_9LAMI